MSKQVTENGIVREWWNDLNTTQADGTAQPIPARSVRFYTAAGAVQSTRAFTAAESVEFDARAAQDVQEGNKTTVYDRIETDMAAMDAIKAQANADIRTDPAQEIKDIAVAVKRLGRVVQGDYTGTD